MSAPIWSFLGVIAAGMLTTVGIMVGRLFDRKANRDAAERLAEQQRLTRELEERKVGKEEFDSITRELREQIRDLRTDLEEEKKMRREADDRADAAERRADAAEQRAEQAERRAEAAEQETRKVRRRVEQLEQAMRAAQVTIPPPDPDYGDV